MKRPHLKGINMKTDTKTDTVKEAPSHVGKFLWHLVWGEKDTMPPAPLTQDDRTTAKEYLGKKC